MKISKIANKLDVDIIRSTNDRLVLNSSSFLKAIFVAKLLNTKFKLEHSIKSINTPIGTRNYYFTTGEVCTIT